MRFLLLSLRVFLFFIYFFFNDTSTTEIYTLSLHDALPIYAAGDYAIVPEVAITSRGPVRSVCLFHRRPLQQVDRKSTRLNSSHTVISYAVFCLKKKKKQKNNKK